MAAGDISANIFSKCSPAIGTNIEQCGTVTMCNALPLEGSALSTAFGTQPNYTVNEALLRYDFEINMCEAKQETMGAFLRALRVPMGKSLRTNRLNSGLTEVAPFVMARQFSPINREYWIVQNGTAVTVGGH